MTTLFALLFTLILAIMIVDCRMVSSGNRFGIRNSDDYFCPDNPRLTIARISRNVYHPASAIVPEGGCIVTHRALDPTDKECIILGRKVHESISEGLCFGRLDGDGWDVYSYDDGTICDICKGWIPTRLDLVGIGTSPYTLRVEGDCGSICRKCLADCDPDDYLIADHIDRDGNGDFVLYNPCLWEGWVAALHLGDVEVEGWDTASFLREADANSKTLDALTSDRMAFGPIRIDGVGYVVAFETSGA